MTADRGALAQPRLDQECLTMTYRARLCRLSLAVVVLTASLSCSKSAAEYIESGDKYFAQGLINEAIVEYRGAVQKDPLSGEAVRSRRGLRTLGRRGPRHARIRPRRRPPARRCRRPGEGGSVPASRGEVRRRQSQANQALAKDPRNIDAHLVLASATSGLKDLDGAIKEVQEAIELDPNASQAYYSLGTLQFNKGDRDAAEAAFKKAVELDPKSVPARLKLAQFLWLAGRQADGGEGIARSVQPRPEERAAQQHARDADARERAQARSGTVPPGGPPTTARTLPRSSWLADYYASMKRNEEARRLLTSLMAEPRELGPAKIRMAGIEYSEGGASRLEPLSRKCFRVSRATAGAARHGETAGGTEQGR